MASSSAAKLSRFVLAASKSLLTGELAPERRKPYWPPNPRADVEGGTKPRHGRPKPQSSSGQASISAASNFLDLACGSSTSCRRIRGWQGTSGCLLFLELGSLSVLQQHVFVGEVLSFGFVSLHPRPSSTAASVATLTGGGFGRKPPAAWKLAQSSAAGTTSKNQGKTLDRGWKFDIKRHKALLSPGAGTPGVDNALPLGLGGSLDIAFSFSGTSWTSWGSRQFEARRRCGTVLHAAVGASAGP